MEGKVTLDDQPDKKLQFGIAETEGEGGTRYWVRFEFSTEQIAKEPLATSLALTQLLMELMTYIKSQWIPSRDEKK